MSEKKQHINPPIRLFKIYCFVGRRFPRKKHVPECTIKMGQLHAAFIELFSLEVEKLILLVPQFSPLYPVLQIH